MMNEQRDSEILKGFAELAAIQGMYGESDRLNRAAEDLKIKQTVESKKRLGDRIYLKHAKQISVISPAVKVKIQSALTRLRMAVDSINN